MMLLAGLMGAQRTAHAASNPPDAGATSDSSVPPRDRDLSQLKWRWQRFPAWEVPLAVAALGGATVLRFAVRAPSANWTGGVLFDDWVEDHTAIRGVRERGNVKTMTDVLFYGSMGYRLVDSAFMPWVVWGSPDIALQMSLVDLESFAFVAITLWGPQALFGRERPYVKRCSEPAFAAMKDCAPDSVERNRSFYAGHPAVVLTAAGLTCTHHAHLPLYGGAADKLACALMISAAFATGVGRVVTEEHHASDLLVGYGVGVIAGFVMPEFLHYRAKTESNAQERVTVRTRRPTVVRTSLVPRIGPHDLGVGLNGVF